MIDNLFKGIFDGKLGQVPAGLCKIAYNGKIAVNTTSGYITFDGGRPTNVEKFAMDLGPSSFFIIPVKTVKTGDIITIKRGNVMKPYYVIEPTNEAHPDTVKVFDYQERIDSDVRPENHIFMGKAYFYGKIVSIWNFLFKNGAEGGTGKLGSFMMLNQLFGNKSNSLSFGSKFNMGNLLPMMLMSKISGEDMFGGELGGYFLIQSMQGNNNIDISQIYLLKTLFKSGDQDAEGISDLFGGFLGDFLG